MLFARQVSTGNVHCPLPVALTISTPSHPYPTVFQAFHRAGCSPRPALPTIEQTERLRSAHDFTERWRLTSTRLHQKIHMHCIMAFDIDVMSDSGSLNTQHPPLDQIDASQAQIFPQPFIEGLAVQ
ncbi:hypothetical protein D3C75_1087890 [compost metagenome]